MFCCTRRENHGGEVVVGVCLESNCVDSGNQLACVQCLQEEHKGHTTSSMRKILPDLLSAHSRNLASERQLDGLVQFVQREFGAQWGNGERTTRENVARRAEELLGELKRQVQFNNEEIAKMKQIFRTLNKNSSHIVPSRLSPNRHTQQSQEELQNYNAKSNSSLSPSRNNFQSTVKSKLMSSNSKAFIDTFSISAKHPYLNLSPDLHSVTKVSHSGHRFAAIGAKPFSLAQQEVKLSIDRSVSGNIMVGACHESIVKEKQFANCYGISNGTYLIGQNGNSALTAISFHHSLTVFNRKEIVGWNFEQGDQVTIGVNFDEEIVYFKREGKKGHAQFSMKIRGQSNSGQSISDIGLRLVVLLQTEGDQVTIQQL